MFSSSGYFRGVTCPYFASGLCERPYCHFRHIKPTGPGTKDHAAQRTPGDVPGISEDGASSAAAGQGGQSSSLLSMVGQAIKQVQRDIERDKATLSTIKPTPGQQAGGAVGPAPGSCVYKPTPIASSSSAAPAKTAPAKTAAVAGKSGLYATRTIVPEYDPSKPKAQSAQYKPTPIKLLKKQKETKPGRYVMDAANTVDDNEYDPAMNFSTKGKGGTASKRPSGMVDGNAKRPKLVEEESEDVAMFSDDDNDETEEEKNRVSQTSQSDSSKKEKAVVPTENKSGVFTMDVNAILGAPEAKSKEASKKTSRTEKEKLASNKKSQMSKSHSENRSKSSSSSSGHKSSAKDKSSHANRESSQKSKSGSSVKNDKNESEKKDSSDRLTVPGQVTIKEENKEEDRNIFNLLMSENSNDSTSSGLKKVKIEDSNKENKKSNGTDSHKKSDKESAGSSSSSSRHRTHSSREGKDGQEKKDKQSSSSSSSSHHKSDSHKRHHSSSHHRHRTSSGSSSNSTKPSSSSSTSSSHKSHRPSTSSSSKHHSSSSKDRHKSSSSKSHHSTSTSSKAPRPSQSDKKSTTKDSIQPKPRSERTFSHVDLFGEDSDASDDVMIVEPPKVDIPVVELSSEDESGGEDSFQPPAWASTTPTKSQPTDSTTPAWASTTPSDTKPPTWASTNSSSEPGGLFFNFDPPEAPSSSSDLDAGDNDNEPSHTESEEEEEEEVSAEQLARLEKGLEVEDTYDECLRIFNEESSRAPQTVVQPKAKIQEKEEEEDTNMCLGKKRVARITEKEANISRKLPPKGSTNRPSAAQVMHNRFLAIHQAAEEAAQRNTQDGRSGKGRVAHSPRPAVSTNKGSLDRRPSAEKPFTTIGTVAKEINSQPVKRKAHIPSKNTLKRPTIPADFGSKVPTSIRQRYLNLFIDEALKIYGTEKDAFDRALTEEKTVYGRSSSKNIYLNVAVNCIKKLRNESAKPGQKKMESPSKAGHKAFSHEALLGGRMAAKTSFTVKRSGQAPKEPSSLSEADLYQMLSKYVLTEDQLVENGFPIMSEDTPGTAVIKTNDLNKKVCKSSNPNERQCVRCARRFHVSDEGDYEVDEECIYHWGKSWKRKIGNSIENRYTCCQEDANASGCAISKGHVHEQNKYKNFKGYMQTMPKSPPLDGNYGVYALDCEMVYTTGGIELARITVINHKLEPVYEQLVKPDKPIIDPNTRFSGLTEDDFIGVTSTIRDIQAVLLSMFSAQTILIGHSLESDLVALRLVHRTVVDTSVVYPHRLGPPYKRALRTLSGEILQKIIQDNVGGHDSQEDARAAFELMLWKLKEDVKKANRR